MAERYLTSEQYAERLGESFNLFRQAMAYKAGTLGARGGSGYAPPGVKALAGRIAPPGAHYGYGGNERPLWFVEDVEAFECALGKEKDGALDTLGLGGVRRPRGLEGFGEDQIEEAFSAAALAPLEEEVLSLRLGLAEGEPPASLAAVGERLKLSRERVRRAERAAVDRVRRILTGPDGVAAGPTGPAARRELAARALRGSAPGSLGDLSDREREVLERRYGPDGRGGVSQKRVAADLRISQALVSRIERGALSKLSASVEDGSVLRRVDRGTLRGTVEGEATDLSRREREVLSRRLGLADGRERSLEEVASELSVPVEEISLSEARAAQKVREALEHGSRGPSG